MPGNEHEMIRFSILLIVGRGNQVLKFSSPTYSFLAADVCERKEVVFPVHRSRIGLKISTKTIVVVFLAVVKSESYGDYDAKTQENMAAPALKYDTVSISYGHGGAVVVALLNRVR